MIRRLVLAAAMAFAQGAFAQSASPFIPPAAPKPKIVRLLALPDYFDTQALEEFERASGYQVAYDAYDDPADVADKWREGPYDLVVLSGPTLAREIGLSALSKLDKARIPNARAIQPLVAAKLAAYDPGGAYAVPVGWFATGLLYDSEKAAKRLGGPPASWASLFAPAEARKMADCGIVLPDARDALFIAAWRTLGVDPARATAADVKSAGALIGRLRLAARAFPAPDVVGALASGAACLAVGDAGEAEAASARSREGGAPLSIRFALPREGGALSMDALAIPRDAPHADEAYALLDFLLRPDIAARDASAARLVSALDASQNESLKRLWPEGAYAAPLASAVQTEWAGLRADKSAQPSLREEHRKHDHQTAQHPAGHGRPARARVSPRSRTQDR
ncbi:MAG: extracellular solute-binding protein [Roseiarcus sp.]|jgi:putrescine transport system substrate-binding protein